MGRHHHAGSRLGTHTNGGSPLLSFRPRVYKPKDSHACCTPWSVFQDGSDEAILRANDITAVATDPPPELTSVTEHCKQSASALPGRAGAIRPTRGPQCLRKGVATVLGRPSTSERRGYKPFPKPHKEARKETFPAALLGDGRPTLAGYETGLLKRCTHSAQRLPTGFRTTHERTGTSPPEPERSRSGCIRFPPNGFAVSLTLFPKCFSPFPRGTCSLSVSCRCLALDGVYHPLGAAFPNNPTRRRQQHPHSTKVSHGTITLFDVPFQVNFDHVE